MAAQVGALRVTVGADIRGLQTGMRSAERQVQRSAGVMQNAVKGVQTSFTGLGTIGKLSLGGAGILAAGSAFLRVADAAKSLQAQLKLATAEYGSFARAQKDVRGIAEGTRSDLLATAELYSALQRNSGQLGTTQEQVARATQTVAEAFKISGAATSEQSAATRQLIQAFQSGVLRGDEFNSVMENAPRLARLLADSLGITVGKLRAMSQEGELTADKLVKAFTDKKFTAGIDAEFKQLPVTFDQAMGQVYNAAIIVFSAFDRGGQFSNSLATFVSDGTEGFTKLEDRAFHFGQQVGDTMAALEAVRDALAGLKTDGIGTFLGLIDATSSWRDTLAGTLGILDAMANSVANLFNAPGNLLRYWTGIGGTAPINNPSNMRGRFLESVRDKRSGADRFGGLFQGGTGRTPPPFKAPPAKAKKAKKGKAAPRDRSDDLLFQFEQEQRQAAMELLRAQQDLAASNAERTGLALQMLDLEKAGFDAELANRVHKAERDFAEKKITASALAEVKVQADGLKAKNEQTDALKRQAVLEDYRVRTLEDIGRLNDIDIDSKRTELQSRLQLAETAAERRDIELRLLDLAEQEERAAIAKLAASKDLLDQAEAARRLAALPGNQALARQGVMQSTRGPWEDYMASLPSTAAKAQEALERLQVQGIEGLTDAVLALSDGLDAAKDSLLKTLRDFFLGMARLELQKGLASILPQSGGLFGLFKGAFNGGIGGGTTAGGDILNSGIYPELGFASGGSFMIGGRGGIDSNIMSINGLPIARVSYGERVNIDPANDHGSGWRGSGGVLMNVYADDADSFRRSEGQITRSLRRRLA